MIIDCHGHYTTAPAALQTYRDAQLARLADPARPAPADPEIGDDEIRATIEANQLRIARERGTDLTIFSPRASAMGHHIADPATAVAWARVCNDLIYRVTRLFPANFAGVCQLPQVAAGRGPVPSTAAMPRAAPGGAPWTAEAKPRDRSKERS